MVYVLLVSTVLLAGFRSVFSKVGNKYITEKQDILNFNFWLFLTGGLIIGIKCCFEGNFSASIYTIAMSAMYALFTLLSQILFMKATDSGDVALSSLVYLCGFIFPTVFGAIAYQENFTIMKGAGIAVILLSFAVSTVTKHNSISKKWFFYAFSAMFSSGMVGILQKIFRMSRFSGEINGFLAVAFVIIILMMFIIMPKGNGKKRQTGFYATAALVGVCFGAVNIINTYLSGVMPGIVMFPAINGGGIVSSGILAYIILHEHISLRKWMGIVLSILGIFMIAM